jgi:hypothetical protein
MFFFVKIGSLLNVVDALAHIYSYTLTQYLRTVQLKKTESQKLIILLSFLNNT